MFPKSQFPKSGPPLQQRAAPTDPRSASRRRVPDVRVTQYYFLDMAVPFTSAQGQAINASTESKNFPLLVKGAWANTQSSLVRLYNNATGESLSTNQVPIHGWAGYSAGAYPMLRWLRPFYLQPDNTLSADFINAGAEPASHVVFYSERPDYDRVVKVNDSIDYRLLLSLNLDGVLNSQSEQVTQQIDFDVLIWGALATVQNALVRFSDTRTNSAWSKNRLPVGAFAGIDNGSNVTPFMMYPTPYLLARNTSIQVETQNAGSETGGYVEFLCERILD